jgi:hypothetical protein
MGVEMNYSRGVGRRQALASTIVKSVGEATLARSVEIALPRGTRRSIQHRRAWAPHQDGPALPITVSVGCAEPVVAHAQVGQCAHERPSRARHSR